LQSFHLGCEVGERVAGVDLVELRELPLTTASNALTTLPAMPSPLLASSVSFAAAASMNGANWIAS
jgi:hypothetical protein